MFSNKLEVLTKRIFEEIVFKNNSVTINMISLGSENSKTKLFANIDFDNLSKKIGNFLSIEELYAFMRNPENYELNKESNSLKLKWKFVGVDFSKDLMFKIPLEEVALSEKESLEYEVLILKKQLAFAEANKKNEPKLNKEKTESPISFEKLEKANERPKTNLKPNDKTEKETNSAFTKQIRESNFVEKISPGEEKTIFEENLMEEEKTEYGSAVDKNAEKNFCPINKNINEKSKKNSKSEETPFEIIRMNKEHHNSLKRYEDSKRFTQDESSQKYDEEDEESSQSKDSSMIKNSLEQKRKEKTHIPILVVPPPEPEVKKKRCPNPYGRRGKNKPIIKDDIKSGKREKVHKESESSEGEIKVKKEDDRNSQVISLFAGRNFKKVVVGERTRIDFDNGDFYYGDFIDGDFNGKGKYYSATFGTYDGEWKNGVRQGRGRNVDADKVIYEGDYFANAKHGRGYEKYENGEEYTGQFKNDSREGFGKYIFENRDFYEGEWKNDKSHGQGREVTEAGVYIGGWCNDEKHGEGVMTTTSGVKIKQIYDNGVLIREEILEPEHEKRIAPSLSSEE